MISSAILIIMIPTAILYLFLQKYIFAGVTSGAVK
jgi:multiple sugar transport system permease protein